MLNRFRISNSLAGISGLGLLMGLGVFFMAFVVRVLLGIRWHRLTPFTFVDLLAFVSSAMAVGLPLGSLLCSFWASDYALG
jgi:hypothetical protein